MAPVAVCLFFATEARADCTPDRFPCFGPTTGASAGGTPGSGTSRALAVATSYLGTNPTGRRRLWCADFVNLVERRVGRPGTGSRASKSYLNYGQRVSSPRAGDIVVLRRHGGGHVGYYKGRDERGNLILVSGNHGGKVAIGRYPARRALGYVRPPAPGVDAQRSRRSS